MVTPPPGSPRAAPPSPERAGLAGDRTAEEGFERDLHRGLAIARRVLRTFRAISPQDAEELAQEIAVNYWMRRARVVNLEAWFFVCARNRGCRFVLRRRLHPRVMPLEEGAAFARPPAPEGDPFLQRLYFTLSEHCRWLLGCLVVAEWTPKELARLTGRKPRDLVSMESRCLKALRHRWRALDRVGRGARPRPEPS